MKKNTNAWWIFFPFAGLDVIEDQNGLASPIFKDVAIVSRKNIRKIVQQLNLQQDMPSENAEFILDMIENPVEEFQSYIVVRRTGEMQSDEYLSKPALIAKERAEQVAALLALVFLARGTLGKTCGLVEQIHFNMQSITMLNLENGSFKHSFNSSSNSYLLDNFNSIKIRRENLLNILAEDDFKGLSEIILPQKSSLPKSIRNAVIQSSVRLTEAIHSPKLSTKLLGAVTAIEILLTDQPTDYKTIKNRISALLGSDLSNQYNVEIILKTRHEYVHEGKEVLNEKTPVNAVALALSCILAYLDIVKLFSVKSSLLTYLDFTTTGIKIQNELDVIQKDSFPILVKPIKHRKKFSF